VLVLIVLQTRGAFATATAGETRILHE